MKDHEKRELVDRVNAVAKQFAGSQQLRERIATELLPTLEQAQQRIAELEKQVRNMALEAISAEGQWIDHTTALVLQVEQMREALLLMNMLFLGDKNAPPSHEVFLKSDAALALSAQPAADLIAAHDARSRVKVIERCAEVCDDLASEDYCIDVRVAADAIRALIAAPKENGNV